MIKISNANVSVKFIGENAENVAGSMILVEYKNTSVLLDMGLKQGKGSIKDYKANVRLNNQISPSNLDYCCISHNHIDHSGRVPLLYRNGFNGKTIIVSKNKPILRYMWDDSMNITSSVARLLNRYDNTDKHEPIYNRDDISKTLDNIIELDFYEEYKLGDDMVMHFIKAGHIWRSGMIVIDFKESHRRLVYTGDLGSNNIPYYFADKQDKIPNCNMVIGESTYCRDSDDELNIELDRKELINTVKNTLRNNKTVLIPAFSLQRTPEILYFLYENLKDWNNEFDIYLDSPLSYNLYNQYSRDFDELYELMKWDKFNIVKSAHQSEALCMTVNKPQIVVASSGMIVPYTKSSHWLKAIVENKDCLLIKAGYAANNTLMSDMVVDSDNIKIMDYTYQKKCKVKEFSTFSSHIQNNEILEQYSQVIASNGFYLVHGDKKYKDLLAQKLNLKAKEFNNNTKFISVSRNDEVIF